MPQGIAEPVDEPQAALVAECRCGRRITRFNTAAWTGKNTMPRRWRHVRPPRERRQHVNREEEAIEREIQAMPLSMRDPARSLTALMPKTYQAAEWLRALRVDGFVVFQNGTIEVAVRGDTDPEMEQLT